MPRVGSVVLHIVRPGWEPPPEPEPRIVVADLGSGEAAQIYHLYGRTTVLVSALAARSLRPIVAAHALRCHQRDLACTTATCANLWPWLRRPAEDQTA